MRKWHLRHSYISSCARVTSWHATWTFTHLKSYATLFRGIRHVQFLNWKGILEMKSAKLPQTDDPIWWIYVPNTTYMYNDCLFFRTVLVTPDRVFQEDPGLQCQTSNLRIFLPHLGVNNPQPKKSLPQLKPHILRQPQPPPQIPTQTVLCIISKHLR